MGSRFNNLACMKRIKDSFKDKVVDHMFLKISRKELHMRKWMFGGWGGGEEGTVFITGITFALIYAIVII